MIGWLALLSAGAGAGAAAGRGVGGAAGETWASASVTKDATATSPENVTKPFMARTSECRPSNRGATKAANGTFTSS